MSYTTVDDVKPILGIALDDLTADLEIEECVESAYSIVNSIAEAEGFSTPFSSAAQNVKDFERYVAAWLFRRRRSPPSEVDFLWNMALQFWNAYSTAQKKDEVAFKVVQA